MARDAKSERRPDSFLKARFQAASQRDELPSEERRRNRFSHRDTLTPPGFIDSCWAVAADFRYDVEREGSGERYVVPAGFAFDGASVPAAFTAFVPRVHSFYMGAAALHDFLYAERHEEISRARADAIFREAMLVGGLNWVWAGLMWRSVRAGGWSKWYVRKPGTWPHRVLTLPMPLPWLAYVFGTAALFLAGVLAVDLWNLRRYRDMAREIAGRDVS